MATRHFACEECGARGKIVLRSQEHDMNDIVYCPVCSGNIWEPDEDDEDEDE